MYVYLYTFRTEATHVKVHDGWMCVYCSCNNCIKNSSRLNWTAAKAKLLEVITFVNVLTTEVKILLIQLCWNTLGLAVIAKLMLPALCLASGKALIQFCSDNNLICFNALNSKRVLCAYTNNTILEVINVYDYKVHDKMSSDLVH